MGLFITLSRWMPLVWLLLSVALFALEAATVDLVAIWFAIGSLIAVIPALMGTPFWVQLAVFLAVSLLTLSITRPMVVDVLKVRKTSTNADQVIGMVGVVIQEINNVESRGRVLVNGLDWSARSDDGTPIEVDERVLIQQIKGVTLIVERVV